MQKNNAFGRFGKAVIVSAGLTVILAGIKLSAELIVPFLTAAFIALLSSVPLFWLHKKGVPNVLSVLLVVLGLLGVGTVLGVTAASSVNALTKELPTYREDLNDRFESASALLEDYGLNVNEYRESFFSMFDPSAAVGFVAGALKKTGGLLANSFMILLTVIFILLEAVGIPKKLRRVSADPEKTFEGVRAFVHGVKQYLVIKTAVSAVTGILAGVCTAVIGVDFPVLWALLAFALNFVPTIGSFIAALPPVLLGLVQLGPGAIVSVGGSYAVINVVMGNLVEPRLTGEGLGLSSLVVFLSLVFWGWLLGPVGMLLSVPLTMIVKIACESHESSRHIGILLGPSVPKQTAKQS